MYIVIDPAPSFALVLSAETCSSLVEEFYGLSKSDQVPPQIYAVIKKAIRLIVLKEAQSADIERALDTENGVIPPHGAQVEIAPRRRTAG